MAPLVKTPATNSNDPNSTPGTHRVNGENHSSKLSSDFHTRVMVCHDPHIQVCAQAHEMSCVQTYGKRAREENSDRGRHPMSASASTGARAPVHTCTHTQRSK